MKMYVRHKSGLVGFAFPRIAHQEPHESGTESLPCPTLAPADPLLHQFVSRKAKTHELLRFPIE